MTLATLERPGIKRFTGFVASLYALVRQEQGQSATLRRGRELLEELVATDDWLPDSHARPLPDRYAQYLLHRAEGDRFSIVAFVWGPGQTTPVHDHRVWGLVGVLRGAELVRDFIRDPDDGLVPLGSIRRLLPGQVEAFGPDIGDIHQVANAFDDRISISIHVYGADIGKVERATYDEAGRAKPFVSGYVEAPVLLP